MKKTDIDLMCLYWTTSGYAPGDGELSRFDFKDRVEAAANAGFKGVGIWHTELEHIMLHRSLKEIKTILDDNGIVYLELEFLTDWFLDGGRKWESDNKKKRLFEASAALNAKHIKIGDFYNTPYNMDKVVDSFVKLCNDAKDYGAIIGFEFMASSMIDNLADALKMVKSAGVENGGIIIDIVQAEVLKIPHEEISAIPAEYLVCVELNDGALPGSPLYDPERVRRFLGEGDFDLNGFINAILNTGYIGPWALEVFSKELACLPLKEQTKRAFQTTIDFFENFQRA